MIGLPVDCPVDSIVDCPVDSIVDCLGDSIVDCLGGSAPCRAHVGRNP